MSEHEGCHEYMAPGRRSFLIGLAGLMGSLVLPGLAVAAAPTEKRLVVILLRGGLDGLAVVPPYADSAYRSIRGALAINDPAASNGAMQDLDGFFGLHPSLKNLGQLYQRRELTVFQAVASPYRERSHFDAQNVLELGTITPHERHDGWLNRALALMGPDASQLGVAFAQTPPLIINGDVPVLSWVPGNRVIDSELLDLMGRIYAHDAMFSQNLVAARSAEAENTEPSSAKGDNRTILSPALTSALGHMMGPDSPHRIAVLDIPGWDTHANQGAEKGLLAGKLQRLDDGVGRLAQALAPVWSHTAIVMMTEFGRTAAINGTGGTDHGTAGMAMLFGGAVNGGHVLSRWPGLDQARLYQGRDLAPTLDMRSVLKGILRDHVGIAHEDLDRHVFPDSMKTGIIRNLMRTS